MKEEYVALTIAQILVGTRSQSCIVDLVILSSKPQNLITLKLGYVTYQYHF
jgi:hypothetical protein